MKTENTTGQWKVSSNFICETVYQVYRIINTFEGWMKICINYAREENKKRAPKKWLPASDLYRMGISRTQQLELIKEICHIDLSVIRE